MEKILLATLLFLHQSLLSQPNESAKQPIPIQLNKDEQFQLIQRDSFIHAWTFNDNKLSLHVYNKDLSHSSSFRLHKKRTISGIPFFHLSFPSYYYVVLPLENLTNIYKVFSDGTSQLVAGRSAKNLHLKLGRIKYVERVGNMIFAVEETKVQNKTLFVLHQFDADFQPAGLKHLLDEQSDGQGGGLYFKAVDDSTFVAGKIAIAGHRSSALTITKLNLRSGHKMVKKFASESAEWRYIRLLADDNKNLYIVNQVASFSDNPQATMRKESSYITKINSAWEVESSISLEGNVRMDSSRRISLQNTHSFLVNRQLLTVSLWTTGLSFSALGYSKRQPHNVVAPKSASEGDAINMIATALSVAPRTDRPGDNRLQNINFSTVDGYRTTTSGALPTYSNEFPDYWKMPVKEYQNFSVIDDRLLQIHPKTINYPSTDAFFMDNNKLVGIYIKNRKLGYYELHHSEGARGLREYELNEAFEFLPWKITQIKDSLYLLPYIYKNELYFTRLDLGN